MTLCIGWIDFGAMFLFACALVALCLTRVKLAIPMEGLRQPESLLNRINLIHIKEIPLKKIYSLPIVIIMIVMPVTAIEHY